MSEQNRFFLWLYRFLAIAGVLLVLLIAGVFVSEVWAPWRKPRFDPVEVAVPGDTSGAPQVRLRIGNLSRISGTDVTMLKLTSATTSRKMRSSVYDDRGETRNLLFLDRGNTRPRWLFPKHDQRLLDIEELQANGVADPVAVSGDGVTGVRTIAISMQVIKADTDGDGEMDCDDTCVYALLHPDGSGYTELTGRDESVLDTTVAEDGTTIGLLIEKGTRLLYREYDTVGFRLRSEREIASIAQP